MVSYIPGVLSFVILTVEIFQTYQYASIIIINNTSLIIS